MTKLKRNMIQDVTVWSGMALAVWLIFHFAHSNTVQDGKAVHRIATYYETTLRAVNPHAYPDWWRFQDEKEDAK